MKRLQILGTGCAKCRMLADHAGQAAAALGLECTIEKVTDLNEIAAFGVVSTPALAVDGEIKVSGRVPTVDAIKRLLS